MGLFYTLQLIFALQIDKPARIIRQQNINP